MGVAALIGVIGGLVALGMSVVIPHIGHLLIGISLALFLYAYVRRPACKTSCITTSNWTNMVSKVVSRSKNYCGSSFPTLSQPFLP